MNQEVHYGVQFALWMHSNWGYIFILILSIAGVLLFFFKDQRIVHVGGFIGASIIAVPIVFFAADVDEEKQKYHALVMQEVAQEYDLNIDGVDSINCVSGQWHYRYGDTWHRFDPAVSCKDDRGLDVRFDEKWPY